MIEECVIETTTHGAMLWRPGADDAPLLIGFHGYAETARVMMQRLEQSAPSGEWGLCAVEGLHSFYSRKQQSVVASWMTTRLRNQAIEDNAAYVALCLARCLEKQVASRVLFAGFSQGVAMAWRAAAVGNTHAASRVIAVAGDIPPELADEHLSSVGEVVLVHCQGDEWYTEEKFAADRARLAAAGVAAKCIEMPTGHEWGSELSKRLRAELGQTGSAVR